MSSFDIFDFGGSSRFCLLRMSSDAYLRIIGTAAARRQTPEEFFADAIQNALARQAVEVEQPVSPQDRANGAALADGPRVQQAPLFHAPAVAVGFHYQRNRYGFDLKEVAAVPRDGERCYTTTEAAAACGLGRSTIQRAVEHGELACFRPSQRTIRIPEHSLRKFQAEIRPLIRAKI